MSQLIQKRWGNGVAVPFKVAAQSKEINSLEDTVAALKEDYERSLSANVATQKDLQDNLISSKHELLRVQEQLALAEKVSNFGLFQELKVTSKHIVNTHKMSSVVVAVLPSYYWSCETMRVS